MRHLVFLVFLALLAPAPLAAQRYVAARELPRGHVLAAGDLAPGDSAAAEGDGVAPGWITRRVVRAGEPLRVPAVAPRALVAVGDTVTVVFPAADGIRLTRQGVALGSAQQGEPVLVRLAALRRVRAVAVGPSTVEVR